MSKAKRIRVLLFILLSLFICSTCLFGFSAVSSIRAENTDIEISLDGAQIKFIEQNASSKATIRFVARMKKSDLDGLKLSDPKAKVIMRIVPKSLLDDEDIDELECNTRYDKIKDIDVTNEGIVENRGGVDYYTFRIYAEGDIDTYKYLNLTCIACVKSNGKIIASSEAKTRSIGQVAATAITTESIYENLTKEFQEILDNTVTKETVSLPTENDYFTIEAESETAYRGMPYSVKITNKTGYKVYSVKIGGVEATNDGDGNWSIPAVSENGVDLDIAYSFDVEYTDSDKEFNFYAYCGPTDGSYVESGETETVKEDFRTVSRYAEYKEAGLNVLLLGGNASYEYTRFSWENSTTKKQVDLAHAAGIDKVIITDVKLFAKSKGEGLIGEGKEFATEADLVEYVKTRLSDYIGYRGVYGVALEDEPGYKTLTSYAQMFKAIKTAATELGYPDFYVQVNLLPYTIINSNFAETWEYAIEDYQTNINPYWSCIGTTTSEQIFEVYLRKFFDLSGAKYIQIDGYPLLEDKTPVFNYVRGLELAAKICNKYEAELQVCTQSASWSSGINTSRELKEEDARWLNNLLLGFGAKAISYFTYANQNDNGQENFNDGTAFITRDGSKTDTYYYMQKIMAENQAFAKTILNFNYNKCTYVSGSTSTAYGYLDSVSKNTLTKITSIGDIPYSARKTTLLVTELVDNVKGNYLYMFQNVTDPAYCEIETTSTITFDSAYNYALVFVNGKTYTAVLNNHQYELPYIYPGNAVFVMPFGASSVTITNETVDEYVPMEIPTISYNKYSPDEYLKYNVGESITFTDFFNTIGFTTTANKVMKSVTYNKVTTSLEGFTGYKFGKAGLYTFKFAGVNNDGYEMEGMVTVMAQKITATAQNWLTTNNATLEGALSMDDNNKLVLGAGTYSGSYDYVPYIAFNNTYTIGDYAMFDFTGRNMPQVAFFADTVTSSLRDNYCGTYISNGMTEMAGGTNSDSCCGRLTIYGPLKIHNTITDFINDKNYILAQEGNYCCWKELSATNYMSPISYLALDEDTHYRYIVGFESGTQNIGSKSEGVIDIYLYNTDSGELIYSNKILVKADFFGTDGDPIIEGKIVAYGRYGVTTTIDKVYAIQNGISNLISEFKETAPDRALAGNSFDISDFVDFESGDELSLIAPNGVKTPVSGTVEFETAGVYSLLYKNGEKAEAVARITVYATPWYKVVYDLNGYTEEEWIYNGGNAGELTNVVAKEFYGYNAENIAQQTINANCSTVVTVNYTKNPLIMAFDSDEVKQYTVDGQSTSFSDTKAVKDGAENTIYSGVFLNSVEIAKEGYNINALKVTNMDLTQVSGYSEAIGWATIKIKLTEEQREAFNNGGQIKFRYRALVTNATQNGFSSFNLKVNGETPIITVDGETKTSLIMYTSLQNSHWSECFLEKRGDAFDTVQEYLTINISKKTINYGGHLWTMWIDEIEVVEDDRPFYTVNHYLADENGEYTILSKTEKVFVDEAGVTTDAQSLEINGFTAKSFENVIVKGDNSTVINIYYDCDNPLLNSFEREVGKSFNVTKSTEFGGKYLAIGSTGYSSYWLSSVEVTDDGYNGGKALKIKNDNDAGGTAGVRIPLSAEQKAELENGGILSIRFKGKLNVSGYSKFNVKVNGEDAGAYTFKSAATDEDWKQYQVSISGDGFASEYLDYVQIGITLNTNTSGTSWTLFVDDVTVTPDNRPFYTVNHYFADENGEYTILVKSEKIKVAEAGVMTNAESLEVSGFTAKAFDNVTVNGNNSTVINIYYDCDNPLLNNFETETVKSFTVTPSSNFSTFLQVENSKFYSVYLNTVEIVEDTDGKALKFTNASGAGGTGKIRIALTESQKQELANGGILSAKLKYRLNVSGGYSSFFITLNGEDLGSKTFTNNTSAWAEFAMTLDGTQLTGTNLEFLQVDVKLNKNTSGTNWTIWVDDITVTPDSKPSYTVNHYLEDGDGNFTVLEKTESLKVNALGETSNITVQDIVKTVNGITYLYTADDFTQVVISENGQVVNVNYSLVKISNDFESKTVESFTVTKSTAFGGVHLAIGSTGYSSYWLSSAEISNEGYNGGKALKIKNDNSAGGTGGVRVDLTTEQKDALSKGGIISVRFKGKLNVSGYSKFNVKVNGEDAGAYTFKSAATDEDWKQYQVSLNGLQLDSQYLDYIQIGITLNTNTSGTSWTLFVDDIDVRIPVSVTNGIEEEALSAENSDYSYTEYQAFNLNAPGYLKYKGNNTLYSGAYIKEIEITDSQKHSGSQSVRFKNDSTGGGTAFIQIDLTEEQKAAMKVGGIISFNYRICYSSDAIAASKTKFDLTVDGTSQGTVTMLTQDYGAGITWKQMTIEITEDIFTNYGDKLVIKTSNSTLVQGTKSNVYNLWIDDVTVSYVR